MWYYYVIAGLISGIVGGMGMGGGTLLIPILTIVLGVAQHSAQGINLLVFIPLGVVTIIIHAINHLIDYHTFFVLVLPAIFSSILAANLSVGIDNDSLKIIFGSFLIVVGVYELIVAIIRSIKRKKPMLKNNIYS